MKVYVLLLCSMALLRPMELMADGSNTIIVLKNKDLAKSHETIARLEALNVQIRHVISQRIILASADISKQEQIAADSNVQLVSESFNDAEIVAGLDESEKIFARGCKFFQQNLLLPKVSNMAGPSPTPLSGDVDFSLWKARQADAGIITSENAWKATSSYMIGRAAVTIILMESNADQGPWVENWTSDQQSTAIAEIIEGLDRWIDLAQDNNAALSWYYDIHYGVPTDYEPITEHYVPYCNIPVGDICLDWRFLWIDDALAYLGYPGGWDGMYYHLQDLRQSLRCDWAFILFVVMDELDVDHMFPQGKFAYSFYEGPCTIMTYNNDSWGPSRMDEMMQHETAHIFGSRDEYRGECGNDDCNTDYGFLQVTNANCETCNPNPASCVMRGIDTLACYFTLGQIGWHDYDGDLWNEAQDRNTRWSQNIWNVNPGDMIDIFDNLGRHVRKIPVTADNHDVNQSNEGFYVWDCTNFDGERVSFQIYYVQVNGQNRPQITPDTDEFIPILSNLNCPGIMLNFTLTDDDTAGDFVRVRILSQGQEISRPVFDKLLFCGQQSVDLSYLPPGAYDVQIRAWDAGGNAASPLSGSIILTPEVPTGLYVRNQTSYNDQWQNVLIDWDAVPAGIGVAVERKTASSNWAEIGRVTGQAYFEDNTALGSEYYYYRIRAYYGSYYSDYSGSYGLRVLPQIPLNFLAYAGNTNRVKVSWNPPVQQLPQAITGYIVRRKAGLYSAYFGPFTSSPVSICSALNASYVFGVKTIDQYNHSSEFTKQDVVTGSWNDCLITPDSPDQSKEAGFEPSIPQNTMLFQNAPNPFNSSTRVEYGLNESSMVTFRIYDLAGRVVKIMNVGYQDEGFYSVIWDGTDAIGSEVSSGVYFFILTTEKVQKSIKVLLLR